jgi:hypothetical protein
MPLMRYFGFVGSALLVSLLSLNWCLPQATSEPVQADSDRPAIRISSDEKLPEAVIIDTNLPTIKPAAPTLEIPELPPKDRVVGNTIAVPVVSKTVGDALKPSKSAKIVRAKKAIESRHALAPKDGPSSTRRTPSAVPVKTRMSLLDAIKEKFGHGFLRLN